MINDGYYFWYFSKSSTTHFNVFDDIITSSSVTVDVCKKNYAVSQKKIYLKTSHRSRCRSYQTYAENPTSSTLYTYKYMNISLYLVTEKNICPSFPFYLFTFKLFSSLAVVDPKCNTICFSLS